MTLRHDEQQKVQKVTACAFLHHGGKVLVAQRAFTKKFMPGIYELPGGHIEFGEEVHKGLAREIDEELGIDIIVGRPYHVFTYVSADGSKHSIEIMFLATLANPKQKISLRPEELAGYEWIGPDQLEKYLKENPEEKKAAEFGFKLIGA